MYERYARRFEARLARLGPLFRARVELLQRAVRDAQPQWQRMPRRQRLCRFQTGRTPLRERPDLLHARIRCPWVAAEAGPSADARTAACSTLYAHRLFQCPWQYQPNSSLTDELGCWRPSTGVN